MQYFYLGQNALTLASHSGNIDIVRLLLDEEWTYKDFTETSLVPPLCVAAMRGHLELVKFYAKLIPGPSDIVTPHGIFNEKTSLQKIISIIFCCTSH